MTKLLSRIGILFSFILISTLVPAFAADQGDLEVVIRPVDNGVEFVLTNNSADDISLLRWETPLEPELTQDVFTVSQSDGKNKSMHAERAMFSGRLIRRSNPQPQDFITIAAGESRSATVPLADYYQLSGQGMHYVSFRGVFNFQEPQKDRSALQSAPTELKTVYAKTGTVEVDLVPTPEILFARPEGYSGCSAQQLEELPGDFDASEQITRVARESLEGLAENERASSPRYLHWFGEYDSEHYAEALDTYAKSEDLMGRGEVEFLCDCDEPYYAFIRRTEPFRVNLCTFYWSAPRLGTDSRAGTILHEVSHFNEVGGTEDHAYGAALASALARNDSSRAVNNADSIEYFAENTPFREISAGIAEPEPQPVPAPEPPAPIVFSSLEVDSAVSGSVARNGREFYVVTGADDIVLTTNSGDADLFVYADEALTENICRSDNSGELLDSCAISPSDTAYVLVFGHSASSYDLVAESDSSFLRLGQTQTVSIVADGQQYFTVSNANFVQINSVIGDADLYVYSDAERSGDSLVCDSRNRSEIAVLDTCELNGASFISVRGVNDGQFTITASLQDPLLAVVDTQSGPADTSSDSTDPAVIATDTDTTDVTVATTGSGGGSAGGGGLFGPGSVALLLLPLFIRRLTADSKRASR